MKEQLVSFETAKLAKERGWMVDKYSNVHFTHHYYIDEPNNYYDSTKNRGELCEGTGMISVYSARCDAPTQSLLQKWLREIYNIHIWILRINKNGYYQFEYSNQEVMGSGQAWKTYEEALEKGLQEALKLIKNDN